MKIILRNLWIIFLRNVLNSVKVGCNCTKTECYHIIKADTFVVVFSLV